MSNMDFMCTMCSETFPKHSIYWLASGAFICEPCFKMESQIRVRYNIPPLKLGIAPGHLNDKEKK